MARETLENHSHSSMIDASVSMPFLKGSIESSETVFKDQYFVSGIDIGIGSGIAK